LELSASVLRSFLSHNKPPATYELLGLVEVIPRSGDIAIELEYNCKDAKFLRASMPALESAKRELQGFGAAQKQGTTSHLSQLSIPPHRLSTADACPRPCVEMCCLGAGRILF